MCAGAVHGTKANREVAQRVSHDERAESSSASAIALIRSDPTPMPIATSIPTETIAPMMRTSSQFGRVSLGGVGCEAVVVYLGADHCLAVNPPGWIEQHSP